ncbi:MAG: response regulator [Gammaproteobacteria bacterium]
MTASTPHVLVIEDEAKIAQLLVDYLERDNYQVSTLADGTNATEHIKEVNPSLVLLDLMLPGKDGLTICREVRQFSDVPIVMLTAKVDEIDRLIGLELGADDYICKPFSPREVVARVKTILRRASHQPVKTDETTLTYRDVIVLPDKYECLANQQRIDLTPVEFRMLQAMVARPGFVFSRDKLMNLAYTDERIVSDRTIDTHIKNIRRKLHDVIGDEELLHSIYGVGYKLE